MYDFTDDNQAGVMCLYLDLYLTALLNLPLQEVILVIGWGFFFPFTVSVFQMWQIGPRFIPSCFYKDA